MLDAADPDIEIVPSGGPCGAEIRGVDLSRDLSPGVLAQIQRAWNEHLVIFFRGQDVTQERQLAFASRFGALGARKQAPAGQPPDRAQRNFTDPDSRIMPSGGGFIAGYNGQIAVDAGHQVIVAHRLVTSPADYAALVPLVDQTRANLGRKPREVSADTGFASEANLAAMAERRIAAYLAPGRIRHGETDPAAGRGLKHKPRMQAMAATIRRAGRRSRYRLRKQVVEPVFGQIKQARGFRQFLLRGLDKVRAEWAMVCTVHNLLKLHRAAA